jgi:hypothetical protein
MIFTSQYLDNLRSELKITIQLMFSRGYRIMVIGMEKTLSCMGGN